MCDAPAVEIVVDDAMQAKAVENRWPDPFAAYEALKDNYLAKGKRSVGVDGWKAALRGWLKRNLDGQPAWDREGQAKQAHFAAHQAREAARLAELEATTAAEPISQEEQEQIDAAIEKLTRQMTGRRDTAA